MAEFLTGGLGTDSCVLAAKLIMAALISADGGHQAKENSSLASNFRFGRRNVTKSSTESLPNLIHSYNAVKEAFNDR